MAVAMMLVLACASCKKDNNNDDGNNSGLSNLKMKQMDLTHAQMLALAESVNKDDGDYQPLYIVNEDGVLEAVEYTIEVEGDGGLVNLVKANLQLKVHYIYQIGTDWLWLFDCRHFYPGIEELSEAERVAILNLISLYDGIHYLVRKSDGAIFKWTLDDGRPWNIVNYGLERPSDYYGVVEQYGNDIVEVKTDIDNSQIYYLDDKGNNIDVSTMIPDGLDPESVYPATNDGVVGATIAYNLLNGYLNYQQFVIFPSSLTIRQVVVPNYNNSLETRSHLVMVDNSLYVMTTNNYATYDETDFRKVEVDLQNETVNVSQPLVTIDNEVSLKPNTIGYQYPVFRGEKISWLQNGRINTVFPETSYYNTMELPTHYPDDAREYIDGVAYVIGSQHDATYYWVCDMATGYAMSHDIIQPDLSEYAGQIVVGSNSDWEFNYNSLAFTSYCMLLDGRKLNFYFSVVGDDAGQVKVIAEGEGGGAGRVISTLIRLN